ncbi:MAG: ABC transporter permease [Propionibacteriaceae bacterium]|jgi:NitT/TauT family transport system permease protein|nr:ABC transporter permease [Propionibacteriaceae bacterium]
MSRTLTTFVAPLGLFVTLVLAWWAVAAVSPPYLLPGPAPTAARLGSELLGASLWQHLGWTLAEAFGGCLLGAAVALPLALLIHRSKLVSAAVNPFLGATQAIPAIALAPLLVLWIGYGMGAVVILCALMVFFPILISARLGLKHVNHELVEAARLDGAGSAQLFWQLEGPLALPAALAGIRNGFTLSITGAVVGEMVMGGNGLGTLLTVQRDAVDTTGMFASLIVLCVFAGGIYSGVRALDHAVSRKIGV